MINTQFKLTTTYTLKSTGNVNYLIDEQVLCSIENINSVYQNNEWYNKIRKIQNEHGENFDKIQAKVKHFRDLSLFDGKLGREDCQAGWQIFVGNRYKNKSILDVGAGLCLSKDRMQKNGNVVFTQDVAPGLNVDINIPIEKIKEKSYDIVTCFDVIEHIVEDHKFLENLVRISKEKVIVTTPNFAFSKNKNPHHYREYDFEGLQNLVKNYNLEYWMIGSANGSIIELHKELHDHEFVHHGFILQI